MKCKLQCLSLILCDLGIVGQKLIQLIKEKSYKTGEIVLGTTFSPWNNI